MSPSPVDSLRCRSAWERFLRPEEGGYQAMPDDPGNWFDGKLVGTCHGISAPVLASVIGRPPTAADMMGLTWAESERIADARYWLPAGGDRLPVGANLMVVDFGWGSGVHEAVLMLQEILGFTGRDLDGIAGGKTALAAIGMGTAALVAALHDRQAAYYAALGSRFLRGWMGRDGRRRDLALKLVTGTA